MRFRCCSEIPSVNRLQPTLAITIAAMILTAQSANAQWRVGPSIGVGFEYDDNPSLNSDSIVSSSIRGYGLDVAANITYDSQLTNFALTPRYVGTRYDKSSELDSDDWFIGLGYLYTGERSSFSLRGSYADEAIRRAERFDVDFDVEDPADIPDDGSGRTLGTANRQRTQITPEWSLRTGPRTLIRIGAGYRDVSYDENDVNLLSDYTEARGLAAFEYAWSERNKLTVGGYYRKNEYDRTSSEFSGYGLTLGLVRSLSENTDFVINAGADSTEDDSGIDHTNPIGEISVVRRLQTSRLLAAYRRTISSSGSSELTVRDSITLQLRRDISERFAVSAGIHVYSTSALDSDLIDLNERDYVQLRTNFIYRFTRVFLVDLDYRYIDIDRNVASSGADSNIVNLWFRYRRIE
jgi:hypothetical protein